MSGAKGMLSQNTVAPPSAGHSRCETWANRAHVRPSARNRLTASRRPGSHGWSSADEAPASSIDARRRLASSAVVTSSLTSRVPRPCSSTTHGVCGFSTAGNPVLFTACAASAGSETVTLSGTEIPRSLGEREGPLLAQRDVERRIGRERKRASRGEVVAPSAEHVDGAVVCRQDHRGARAVDQIEDGVDVAGRVPLEVRHGRRHRAPTRARAREEIRLGLARGDADRQALLGVARACTRASAGTARRGGERRAMAWRSQQSRRGSRRPRHGRSRLSPRSRAGA